jgi:hypothetical protein
VKAPEDRLREAYRAVADTIDPDTVASPPMRTHRSPTSARRTGILTPLAAAAGVTAIVVATATLGRALAASWHRFPYQ